MKTIYYSEKTGKQYNSEEECVAAEKAWDLKHSEELKAKEAKKALADEVTKSFVELYEAEKEFDAACAEARKVFKEAYEAAEAKLEKVQDKNNSLVKTFCEKYPEGYHQTIKFDDNHQIMVSRCAPRKVSSIFDLLGL